MGDGMMISNSNNGVLYRESSATLPGLCSGPWSILVPLCSPHHVLTDHSLDSPPPRPRQGTPAPVLTNAYAPPLHGMIICPSK